MDTEMEKQQSISSSSTNNNMLHQHQQQRKQQATITKNNHNKKFKKKITKPIKVVYISNPMKVKTSVSEFRSLVQQLTGRDSELGTDDDVDDDNNDLISMGQYHSRFPSAIVQDPPPPPHHHATMKQEEVPVLIASAKNDDVLVGITGGRRVQEVPAVVAGSLLNDAYGFPSLSPPLVPPPSAAAFINDDYDYEHQYYYFDNQDGFVPQMMIDNNFNGFLPSSTTTSTSICDLFLLHEQLLVAPAPAL